MRVVPLWQDLCSKFGIAIHGFWIPAIPAGMTRCVDAYAFREESLF